MTRFRVDSSEHKSTTGKYMGWGGSLVAIHKGKEYFVRYFPVGYDTKKELLERVEKVKNTVKITDHKNGARFMKVGNKEFLLEPVTRKTTIKNKTMAVKLTAKQKAAKAAAAKAKKEKEAAKKVVAKEKAKTKAAEKKLSDKEKKARIAARRLAATKRQTAPSITVSKTGKKRDVSYNTAADKRKQALKPGRRVSKTGNVYYESRKNHSDLKKWL